MAARLAAQIALGDLDQSLEGLRIVFDVQKAEKPGAPLRYTDRGFIDLRADPPDDALPAPGQPIFRTAMREERRELGIEIIAHQEIGRGPVTWMALIEPVRQADEIGFVPRGEDRVEAKRRAADGLRGLAFG